MSKIKVFCFGFGQVAKYFIKKIIKDNQIISFHRYYVGEGIEKNSEDFAQEVYNQIS